MDRQRITNERVDQAAIAASLESLVIAPELAARLGPAVNAGRGMLLYGAPGDGKTSIARAIAMSFTHSIWVPYALEVEREVIKLYDPAIHTAASAPVKGADDLRPSVPRGLISGVDGRWVRCARPVVLTGGELTMDMLELRHDDVGKYYEAPLHTKMTGGVFIVDDFGRQIAKAEQVLNRWTLPLESRIDFSDNAYREEIRRAIRRPGHLLDEPDAADDHGRSDDAANSIQLLHRRADRRGVP